MKINKLFLLLTLCFTFASTVRAEEFPLTVLTDDYPHIESIRNGKIKIPECKVDYKITQMRDVEGNFEGNPAADVVEVNMLAYLKRYANEQAHDWVLVPVFLWRSFPNKSLEEIKKEFLETRVFPIRTALAIRTELIKENPWLPEALFIAFSDAKREALEAGAMPKPFGEETSLVMGKNYWSYGVKNNPKSLASLFKFAHEQGIINEDVKVDDIFAPETLLLVDEKGNKN